MKKKVWVTRDEDSGELITIWKQKPKLSFGSWDSPNQTNRLLYDEEDVDKWPFGNRKFGLKPGGIKQMTLEINLTDG